MADVKIIVAERGGVELDALEEASPTTDVILAKGLKTAATDLTLEDGANGSVTLTEVLKIKVSSNDTTPGYLLAKLVAGTGVTLTELNDAGDEDIRIAADSLTLEDLTDIIIDSPGPQPGDILVYDGSLGIWMNAAPAVTADKLVGISSNDTTPDYLLNKVTAGTGITLTEIGDGGDEDLQIAADALTLEDLTDIQLDSPGPQPGDILVYDGSSGLWANEPPGTDVDERVSVSSNDTTPGYLIEKFIAGLGVSLVEVNDAGDEDFRIDVDGLTLNDLTDIQIDSGSPAPGDILVYDGSSGLWIPEAPGVDADQLVRVSSNDTTSGYLAGKLLGGLGVTLVELNDGGDEDLRIDVDGLTLGDLTDIFIDSTGPQPGDILIYDGSSGLWLPAAPDVDDDELVKISANDTTPGFLLGKVVAGLGVSLVELNDGGDEDLRIDVDGLTLTDLTDIFIDSTGPQPGDVLIYDGSSGLWLPGPPATDFDEKVGVTSNDTTPGYLFDKIIAGTGVSLVEVGDGGDEDLRIDVDGLTLEDITNIFIDSPGAQPGDILVYDGSSGLWINMPPGVATDELVSISANDTTPGYLLAKVVAGTGITLTELSDGGDEDLQIAADALTLEDLVDIQLDSPGPQPGDVLVYDGSSGLWVNEPPSASSDELTKVSSNDTTSGYLLGKLTTGTGVTLTEINDAGDEDLQIGLSLGAIDHDLLLNFVANEHIDHTSISVVAGGDDALAVTTNNLSANIGLIVDIVGTTTGTPVSSDLLLFHDVGTGLRSATISTIVGASVTAFGIVTGDTGTATADVAADTLQIEGATAGGIVTLATDGPELLTIELDISDLATDAGPLVGTDTFALDDGTAANKKVTLAILGSSISQFIDLNLEDLTDVVIDSPGAQAGDVLTYDGSSGTWINTPLSTMDELLKISANDTTSGYLLGKVTAGTGITLTEINDGGDEDLQIAADNLTLDDMTDVMYDSAGPQVGDILEWNGSEWVNMAPGTATSFGDEFLSAVNLATASTTSTTPIQRLSISATGMTASYTYMISWSYTWRYSSTANDFMAQIDQDNGTILWVHDQEPKDTATTQRSPSSGFALVTGLTGSHTFDLDWWSESGSQSAFIYNARMTFWRVT